MPTDLALLRRLEHTWALTNAELARQLKTQDASWGTVVEPLAGGRAVFTGVGLYVNRLLGAGLDTALSDDELEQLEALARGVGVPAAVDVTDAAHPGLADRLRSRGYQPRDQATAVAMTLPARVVEQAQAPAAEVVVDQVAPTDVERWQVVAAEAWGHHTPPARRASDAWAAAAASSEGEQLLVARAADDGRPLACASLNIRDGVATLGGMATLPAERRKGVQRQLVAHRLALATDAGCDLAATTASTGSDSERNLLRLGFEVTHHQVTWERQT